MTYGTGSAKWLVYLLLMLALLCGGLGVSPQPSRGDSPTAKARPTLAFLVWHFSQQGSGLVVAGWDDGLVVFASDPAKPGANLQTGRILRADLDRALTELHDAGFFSSQYRPGIGPDMSHATMSARRADKTATHQWTQILSPQCGTHVGAEKDFRDFARMWAVSRTALAFAYPKDYAPLATDPEAERRSGAVRRNNETIP